MTSSKAFAPANVSCIFKIYQHKNPRWMGSYGIGFTLSKGVIAEASMSKRNEVVFNNNSINLPTVADVINRLTRKKIRIRIKSGLPLGCGFGLSGASALASAYAVNKLLNLKKSNKELAIIAHTAEVENKTGLGDVVNQFYGGFCMKIRPSSHFEVRKLSINNIYVYCRYFGGISTKSIISDMRLRKKINNAASTALNQVQNYAKINKKMRFNDVIQISKEFASKSGLLKDKRTIKTISEIEKNKGNASMIMLGNAVFSDTPFKNAVKLRIKDNRARTI